ncbi:FtsX-like permease family protein [Pseudomonas sp. R2.Fl]|nr:FtsX-like permease family protein [Pseudomonas sp. R2.Fl]
MIRFILSDLRRLWAGSLAICLLVALSTALVVTVTLQERALRLGSARAADKFDLVIGAAGSETQLVLSSVFLQAAPLPLVPGKTLADLQADPRVAWAAPVAFGDSFAGHPIVGTTRVLIENTTTGFSEGRMFVREGEAVVGSAVGLRIGGEVKPMHGTAEEGGETHTELAYTVTGKLRPTGTPWDRAILVPVQAVWHIHGLGGHDHEDEHEGGDGHAGEPPAASEDHHEAEFHVDEASASTDLPDEAEHTEATHADEYAEEAGGEHDHEHGHIDPNAAVDETFDADAPGLPAILVKPKTVADAYKLRQDYRTGETLGVFPGEVLTKLYATLGDAKRVLSAVAVGAQVLVACALLLVTVVHIGQRRRQIGALRAFGAPRLSVSMIVWTELMALVVVGVATGVAVGFVAARFISDLFARENGFVLPVEFARSDAWQIGAMLLLAAVLAALPALLAYRQSPAAALRS